VPVSRSLVLASCTIVVILTNAGQASFGLLVPFMEAEFSWSRSEVTLPFMVAMIVWGLSSPIWGKLADDYGARPIMLGGVVLMTIGFAVMGFAENLWQMALAFGVLVGGAKGAASHTIGSLLISKHYDATNRARAVGVLQAASPLHPVLFAPLLFILITAFDWRAAVFLTSATLLVIALPLAWLGLRDPEGERRDGRARLGWAACLPYLRDRNMVLLFVARIACGLAVFQGVHMVTFAMSKGHSTAVGVAAVSVVGISMALSALMFGWLADRYGRPRMLGLSYAVRGVGSLLLALTVPNELWFFVLVAIASGPVFATVAIQNVLFYEAVGPRLAGLMLGLSFIVHQIASAIGPQVASILFDATGSYNQYQLAVGFILLFSAAITFNLKDIGKEPDKSTEPRLPVPALSAAPARA
jgi:MFS family permease